MSNDDHGHGHVALIYISFIFDYICNENVIPRLITNCSHEIHTYMSQTSHIYLIFLSLLFNNGRVYIFTTGYAVCKHIIELKYY